MPRIRGRLAALAALAITLGLTAVAALALVRVGVEWRLRSLPEVPDAVRVPPYGDAAEGARLGAVLGCSGCHNDDLGGNGSCYEQAGRFRLVCPNVTEALERYDDRELVTLLRYGRKRNGAMVDFMPWDMYQHLSERDLGHLLAYVRSVPVVSNDLPASWYSWRVRWEMLVGEYPWINDLADYDATPLDGAAARGRYLAQIACPECHAPDLRGYPGDDAPNLLIAKAYSDAAFARLMRDGITLAGTESTTGLMSAVARKRFRHLRPDEVADLKAYLDLRAP